MCMWSDIILFKFLHVRKSSTVAQPTVNVETVPKPSGNATSVAEKHPILTAMLVSIC